MLPSPPPPGASGGRPSFDEQPPVRPDDAGAGSPGVRISGGAPLGVLLLGLLLTLGPASRPDAVVEPAALFVAGILGAGAVFAALTVAEVLTGWRARRLGLTTGTVVVGGWGPALTGAEAPRDARQARALGRTKPLVTVAGGLALLLGAAAALGAGWAPLAASLLGAALLVTALGVLDLLPGPGRSGGLLVLARAWRRGDRSAAELAVARSGVRTGWVLVVAGLVAILLVGLPGLWISLVGWLTLLHSRLEQARAGLAASTASVPARDVMTVGAPEVQGWRTAESLLAELGGSPHQVLPLRRFDGSLQVLLVSDLYAVPADDRDLRRVQDLARPAVVLAPDDPVRRLLDAPAVPGPAGLPVAPFGLVVVDEHVLGVVGPAELARAGAAGSQPGPRRPDGPGDGAGPWPPSRWTA